MLQEAMAPFPLTSEVEFFFRMCPVNQYIHGSKTRNPGLEGVVNAILITDFVINHTNFEEIVEVGESVSALCCPHNEIDNDNDSDSDNS
jgi:hypothetical protein